jgi:hypothetical protein
LAEVSGSEGVITFFNSWAEEILWMEEILHHLGWLKPYKSWLHQLVQDFFYPQ